MLEEYWTRYWDFTAKHFHEHLVRRHGFEYGYTWTKTTLQRADLVPHAPRRGGASQRWPQRPLPGMLVFQDGSPFRWLAGLGYDLDLIVTMDDATGEFYSAFLWPRKAADPDKIIATVKRGYQALNSIH